MLLEWVAKHKSSVTADHDLINPVSCVTSYGKSDRTIVAKRDLQSGAELVTLKHGAFLNGSHWLDHFIGDDKDTLLEKMSTMQLSGTVKTAMALLAELAQADKSDFHGYIQQLPTAISLPFSWSAKLRESLNYTAAFPILDDKLVLKLYKDCAVPLMTKFPSIWPTEVSTLRKFQWAYAIISSRAFEVTEASEPTLLPVIDMANHSTETPAAHIVKIDSSTFQLIALRKVEKGEPVTISYGDLSNAQLLCRYGFVLPAPLPSDSIHITSLKLLNAYANIKERDVDHQSLVGRGRGQGKASAVKRRKVTESGTCDHTLFFALHGDAEQDYGIDNGLLSFVMASKLPTEQLYDVLAVILQEKDKQYSDVLSRSLDDASSEIFAVQQLIQHERQVCRRILLGLMSLEEDSDSSEEEDV